MVAPQVDGMLPVDAVQAVLDQLVGDSESLMASVCVMGSSDEVLSEAPEERVEDAHIGGRRKVQVDGVSEPEATRELSTVTSVLVATVRTHPGFLSSAVRRRRG
jgi:hypothetical protein